MSAQVGLKRPRELEENGFNLHAGVPLDTYMSQKLHKRRTAQRSDSEDSDSSDESDEDDDDESSKNMDPAQAGVIQKITLKNFMCHDFFELELGPQINFIIGRNGSGKSAILTGISVGLGAKATDTNRGGSIKDMIKDNKSTARIIIVLLNEGNEAYQPDVYGKRIIVERKLQRTGTNSYFLKSEDGKVISTKKSILDDILHQFSITIDNPLAFLSQDKAREFLTSTTDQTKYEYFMKGANISEIIVNYTKTGSKILEIEKKTELVSKQASAFKEKYRIAKLDYEKYRSSDTIRRKLQLLSGKIYWFNVLLTERKRDEFQDKLSAALVSESRAKGEISKLESKIEQNRVHLQTLEGESNGVYAKLESQRAKVKELQFRREENKSKIDESNTEIKNRETEIKSYKERIKRSLKEIENEQKRIDEINGQSKNELHLRIEELKGDEMTLKEEKKSARDELNKLENSEIPNYANTEKEHKQSHQTINNLKSKKNALLHSQQDKYAAWGRNFDRLIKAIREKDGWHKQPIGPIGSFIEVKEEYSKWKPLLNAVLSKTLDSFLVCDEHDRKLLTEVFRSFKIQKNIIVRKFELFDYARGKVKDQTTFLDMLNIANENVLYTLIDVSTIEKFIICRDTRQAESYTTIPNVLSVFSLLSDRSGQRSSKTNGTFRIDPIYYRNDIAKFSVGSVSHAREAELIDFQIGEEKVKVESLIRKLRQLKSQRDNLISASRQKYAVVSKKLEDTIREIRKVEGKLNENGDFAKIEGLKVEIVEYESQIKTMGNVIVALVQDISSKKDIIQKLKSDLIIANGEAEETDIAFENLQQKMLDLSTDVASDEDHLRHYKTQIIKAEALVIDYKEMIKKGDMALKEKTLEAEQRCRKKDVTISPEDTAKTIQKEYEDVQRQVKEAENQIGRPLEEVQQEVLDTKEKSEIASGTYANLLSSSREIKASLNMRLSSLLTTIESHEQNSCRTFENSLALRGLKGRLAFNHSAKTLTLLAATKDDAEERSVESLSGGEKSFSQIALLLSIWRSMSSKVRGLDEFDVFMDSVNRSISIKLLLKELREYPKSQNIFITPQDIAVVGDLDRVDVKIHKMSDPRSE